MDTKQSTIRDLVIPIDRYPHLNENQNLQEAIQSFISFRAGQQERPHYAMLFVVNDLHELVGKLFFDGYHAWTGARPFAGNQGGKV